MECLYCKKKVDDLPYKPYSEGFCSWDCKYGHKQLSILKQFGVKLPDGFIEPRDLPLTEAQEQFCEIYIEKRSAYRAFKEAFNTNGLSIEEIRKRGRFTLKLPFIKRRINELIEEYKSALPASSLNVIEKFAYIGNADIRDYLTPDGRIKDPDEWTYEMGIACKKVSRKYDKDGNIKEENIELYDKLKALAALAKIEKMYQDTLEVNVNHSITATVKQFGENDIVAKLVNEELKQIENFAAKDVIDVEAEE